MNSVFPAIVDWSLLAYDPPGWGRALFFGLLNTLQIAVGGYLFGLLLGVCGAAGKLYGSPVIKDLLAVYTTVVRGIPELVLLLILYYAGTQFLNTIMAKLGYGSVDVSGLVAGIIVIGLVQGAYATEVIRGAILAIAPGQIEAGRAFGMSPIKVMHRITLPAMLPFAIPGLSNLSPRKTLPFLLSLALQNLHSSHVRRLVRPKPICCSSLPQAQSIWA